MNAIDKNLLQLLSTDLSYLEKDSFAQLVKQFLKLNKGTLLSEQLSFIVKKKEVEIEKICADNYESLSNSFGSVQYLRNDCQDLKQNLVKLKNEFNEASEHLISQQQDLYLNKLTLFNVENSIKSIKECLKIFQSLKSVNFLLESKRYYSALKALRELEDTLYQDYSFIQKIKKYHIPQIRDTVKGLVLSELNDWLVVLKQQSSTVGRVAMDSTRSKSLDSSIIKTSSENLLNVPQTGIKQSHSERSIKSIDEILSEDVNVDPLSNERVKIDFKPFYQCLHIHQVLDSIIQLRIFYEEQRRLQANLIFTNQFHLSENDVSQFEDFIHQIVGYFIIERCIVNTTTDFRQMNNVNLLWESATNKMKDVVTLQLNGCKNPNHFMVMKEIIICFVKCMETFDFDVNKLVKLLLAFFEQYSTLRREKAVELITNLIQLDEGNAYQIETQDQLKRIQKVYNLKVDQNQKLPHTVPFSKQFIDICSESLVYIQEFYKFGEGFYQNISELSTIIKNGIVKLITEDIPKAYTDKASKNNIKLSEIVRMMINSDHYYKFVLKLDDVLDKKRFKSGKPIQIQSSQTDIDSQTLGFDKDFVTKCQQGMEKLRQQLEDRLFQVFYKKVDEFIELQEYDFSLDKKGQDSPKKNLSPITRDSEPSQYLSDLTIFLQTLWSSTFTELSDEINQLLKFNAIHHICQTLTEMLLAPSLKKISPYFVEKQLKVDVLFLKDFIVGLNDEKLLDPFEGLNQIVNLLKKDSNLEQYMDQKIRNKDFNRLQAKNVLILLEKYRDGGVWGDSYFSFATSSRDQRTQMEMEALATRKKSLDNVIKQLKEEINKK